MKSEYRNSIFKFSYRTTNFGPVSLRESTATQPHHPKHKCCCRISAPSLSREADQSTDPPKNTQLKDMDPPDPFPPDTVDESFRPAVVVVVEVALPPLPLLVMSPVWKLLVPLLW